MSSTSSSPDLPSILIVSPALADANNGNWHTASRWARMLGRHCRIGIARHWQGEPCGLLIALHARRSAPSIAAFAAAHPDRPLVVVLTGTDLYRDIRSDAGAQRSLELATRLVVLQQQGPAELGSELAAKCSVVFQSAPRLKPSPPPSRTLRVVCVGHLREEKDPATFMRSALRLSRRTDISFAQIGGALDPALARQAASTALQTERFRWLGELPRAATRQHIRVAHVLVSPSRMEGGAQVIVEAAQSATAVIASRISGHLGLLGAEHPGSFDVGDDAALAGLIARAQDDRTFLASLRERTVARACLFEPAHEERALLAMVRAAMAASAGSAAPASVAAFANPATAAAPAPLVRSRRRPALSLP